MGALWVGGMRHRRQGYVVVQATMRLKRRVRRHHGPSHSLGQKQERRGVRDVRLRGVFDASSSGQGASGHWQASLREMYTALRSMRLLIVVVRKCKYQQTVCTSSSLLTFYYPNHLRYLLRLLHRVRDHQPRFVSLSEDAKRTKVGPSSQVSRTWVGAGWRWCAQHVTVK